MKIVSFDFYWVLSEKNSNALRNIIFDKKFQFEPSDLIFDADYSFEEGLRQISTIDILDQGDISIIVTGSKHDTPAKVYFNISRWGDFQLAKIHISMSLGETYVDTFDNFLKIPNLFFACIYDQEDKRWQSEQSINTYQQNKRAYSHLPLAKNKVNETVIDTTKNFGRSYYTMGIQFLAASKMYFGELFFKIVTKNTLMSISKSMEISNNIVFIDLFDIYNDNEAFIRSRQDEFLTKTQLFTILKDLHEKFVGTAAALKYLGITF